MNRKDNNKKNNITKNSITNDWISNKNWLSQIESMQPVLDDNEFLSMNTMPFDSLNVLKLNSDFIEEKDNYKLVLETPGMKESEIEISIVGNQIEINGTKKSSHAINKANIHKSEISYGAFSRTFEMPSNSKLDKITANLDEGILTISIPKIKVKTKKIEIKKQKK